MKSPEIAIIVLGIVLATVLSAIAVIVLRRLASGPLPSLLDDVLSFLGILGCVLIAVLLFLLLAVLMGPAGDRRMDHSHFRGRRRHRGNIGRRGSMGCCGC